MYEHCFKGHSARTRSKLRTSNVPLVGFFGEVYHPLGVIDLSVTMGEPDKYKKMLVEFAIVKCHSPYNAILGRTRMRILRAVGDSYLTQKSSHNGNQQGGPSRMQTNQGNIKLYEGDAMAPSYGVAHKDKGKGDTPGPGRPMQKRPQG
ncbi:hypothetical protein Tco_1148836 [Tanacetum coccineum]